jgi:hypothetical protein
LLSPSSWACSNLAGEFQYGTFSIFINAAVVLIWKFPLTFPQQAAALSIAHLFVLAAGAFLLARDRRFNVPLSIFVALIAALNGWIICWGAIDWFGALGAFAWLPWAWWALERAQDRQRTRWRFLWPAPFVYLVVTGGFPYTVVMLALLIAWLSIKSLIETKSFMSILPMIGGAALGFGLSAPAWLALLDYTNGSARAVTSNSAHWQWIVPLSALPGFILPSWTVNWADFSTRMMPHSAAELACGLVAPIALMAALLNRGRAFIRHIRWDLLLLLLVLLLSMLPSAGVFRWSFRWLPLFHLLLALCAAEALRDDERRGLVALLFVGVAIITMSILPTTGDYAFPLAWIFLGLAGIWAATEFWLRASKLQPWIPASITAAAFLATYLCIPPNCGVPKYNLSQELTKPQPLDPQRLYLSIYPPAEHTYRTTKKSGPVGQIVRPGSTSMFAGLRFINGYSPILADGIAREYKFAIHGEIQPDIGKWLVEWERGRGRLLALFGVDGIVIATESDVDLAGDQDWRLVFSSDEGKVFHRAGPPFEPVRSVTAVDLRPNEEFATAALSRIDDSRNQLRVDVDVPNHGRPALLIFSRPYFRGYVAKVAGKALAVDSYRGFFPMVELPAGTRGQFILQYRPPWLLYGGGLSILSATIFLAGVVVARIFSARA